MLVRYLLILHFQCLLFNPSVYQVLIVTLNKSFNVNYT